MEVKVVMGVRPLLSHKSHTGGERRRQQRITPENPEKVREKAFA